MLYSGYEDFKVKDNTKENIIKEAIRVLESGGLIIFPTETCYGLGADATNPQAIKKLFQYKSRREGKPLSIAVSDPEMAKNYVEINELAENIYQNYLPGPITVISKSLKKTAPGVDSEYGTLGIRWPDYPLVLEIIKKFKNLLLQAQLISRINPNLTVYKNYSMVVLKRIKP